MRKKTGLALMLAGVIGCVSGERNLRFGNEKYVVNEENELKRVYADGEKVCECHREDYDFVDYAFFIFPLGTLPIALPKALVETELVGEIQPYGGERGALYWEERFERLMKDGKNNK